MVDQWCEGDVERSNWGGVFLWGEYECRGAKLSGEHELTVIN